MPEEWEASDPSWPSVSVVGRGGLIAEARSEPYDYSGRLDRVDDPTPVAIRLYTVIDGQVVESGTELAGLQYRYGSDDPYTIVRDPDPLFLSRRDRCPGFAVVGPVDGLKTGERTDNGTQPRQNTEPNQEGFHTATTAHPARS